MSTQTDEIWDDIRTRAEKDAKLLEFRCVEFAEEMMYGHLRKQAD